MDSEPNDGLTGETEFLGVYNGFRVVIDPELPPGWVQLRDPTGKVLAMIYDVGEIRIARKSS